MESITSAIENLVINGSSQVEMSEPKSLGSFLVPERFYHEDKAAALSHKIEFFSLNEFKKLSKNHI